MLKRSYFAEYEKMSQKILKYRGAPPPLDLIAKYEKALSHLREHLHQNKINMPLVKYPYDPEDITSHAYIRHVDLPHPIPNPNYKFKDFWKRIDGVRGIQ